MKKRKVYEKFNNVTTQIKLFTSIFLFMEKDLLKNIVWESAVYTITFLVNFF